MPSKPPIVLTLAGFDPSGGAGITADLAVYAVFGLFGTAAITSRTVQSTRGVAGREDSSAAHLHAVLRHLEADLPPTGVKIGALGNRELAETAGNWLSGRKINIPVVWDPALVSSSGMPLIDPNAVSSLHRNLLPEVSWATPNWSELATLAECAVRTEAEALDAAHQLQNRHPGLGFIVTGGDQQQPTDLLILPSGQAHRLTGEHIESTATHGTGCAFSSAFLAGLVLGQTPEQAAREAKAYVSEAIRRAPGIGTGHGPLNLYWPLSKRE